MLSNSFCAHFHYSLIRLKLWPVNHERPTFCLITEPPKSWGFEVPVRDNDDDDLLHVLLRSVCGEAFFSIHSLNHSSDSGVDNVTDIDQLLQHTDIDYWCLNSNFITVSHFLWRIVKRHQMLVGLDLDKICWLGKVSHWVACFDPVLGPSTDSWTVDFKPTSSGNTSIRQFKRKRPFGPN